MRTGVGSVCSVGRDGGPEPVYGHDVQAVGIGVRAGSGGEMIPATNRDPKASRSWVKPRRSVPGARAPALTSKATTVPSSCSMTRSTSAPSLVRQWPRVTGSSSQDTRGQIRHNGFAHLDIVEVEHRPPLAAANPRSTVDLPTERGPCRAITGSTATSLTRQT